MPSLPLVITGTGRSGTTFLTHLFLQAGYDLGGEGADQIGKGTRPSGGGLEWSRFGHINKMIFKKLRRGENPSEIAASIRPHIPVVFPAVVKGPLFIFTFHVWELAGYVPEHVFLCMRNPDATQQSFCKSFSSEAGIHRHVYAAYCLQTHALQSGIPFTPVAYPRIGQDAEYADRTLAPFMDSASRHARELWNDSLHSCPQNSFTTLQHTLAKPW